MVLLAPNIKIDGDFTYGQYVEYSHVNDESYVGTMRAIKTFASSDAINFYVEGNADMNTEIMEMYLDGDNNAATGFATWIYPAGSGVGFLCEGSPVGQLLFAGKRHAGDNRKVGKSK